MYSDHIRVPLAQMRAVASSLDTVHTDLVAAEAGAEPLYGADVVPNSGENVRRALQDFYDEWKQSRQNLIENVSVLSDVTTKIVDHVQDFDFKVADEIKPAADNLWVLAHGQGPRAGVAGGQTDVYAFGDSAADTYQTEIGNIQTAIYQTLEAIDLSVESLRESWEGTESDQYRDFIYQWKSGAAELTGVLTSVKNMLEGIQQANTEMRGPVNELLDEQTNR
ncbi:WXG100 family type VII secretion target [Corynebacterium cystitidis]|uniref:WXG100 family type VII secretion target n=2 Tax=Corynebacterium cystitidis TaxID=35757 RepID=UPI00211DD1A5|nr:WXG100 family type VII secretion target [Corynebacterium cystitidis]